MERADLEAWADQLLDQHRTAPKGAARAAGERVPPDRLDPMTRMMVEAGVTEAPDWATFERMQRAAQVHQRSSNLEAMLVVLGLLLACGFLLAVVSSF